MSILILTHYLFCCSISQHVNRDKRSSGLPHSRRPSGPSAVDAREIHPDDVPHAALPLRQTASHASLAQVHLPDDDRRTVLPKNHRTDPNRTPPSRHVQIQRLLTVSRRLSGSGPLGRSCGPTSGPLPPVGPLGSPFVWPCLFRRISVTRRVCIGRSSVPGRWSALPPASVPACIHDGLGCPPQSLHCPLGRPGPRSQELLPPGTSSLGKVRQSRVRVTELSRTLSNDLVSPND